MTLSTDDLKILTRKQEAFNDKTILIFTKYIPQYKKLFSIGSQASKLYMMDFGDKNDPLKLQDFPKLFKRPTAVEVSPDDEMVSIGFEDGTINIHLTAHLAQKLRYKRMDYRPHDIAIVDQKFIGTSINYRLATADYTGRLIVYCLKDKQVLLTNDPPKLWSVNFGNIVINPYAQRLFLMQSNKVAPVEEFNYDIDCLKIEEDINSNLQENINKRFLWSRDHKAN